MPRTPRIVMPGHVYHIIGRGNNKARIFHDAKDYATYLGLLASSKSRFSFSIFHYAIMPNHVHLIIRPNGENASIFMHDINLGYSKYYRKRYKFVGHVWQGRYKSLLIGNDAYLFSCGNYIEMNPVRAKIVFRPEDWRYSSYRRYAYGENMPLVDCDPFYPSIAATAAKRREAYRNLVGSTRA